MKVLSGVTLEASDSRHQASGYRHMAHKSTINSEKADDDAIEAQLWSDDQRFVS
jgi:hypothetical protein